MRQFLVFLTIVILFVSGLYLWKNFDSTRKSEPVGSILPIEQTGGLIRDDEEFTRLVASVVPRVVSITTAKRVAVPLIVNPFDRFFGPAPGTPMGERIKNSLGSGVLVSKEGHILTNHHVIEDMDSIQVELNDGRVFPAQIVGSDRRSDLAVLKIDATGLTPLPLGDSDKVRVGQRVFAIGNPFGLNESVSAGIISAKGRRTSDDSTNELFQTDAAINPGNSGGPLINVRGEVIGINSSIFGGSGGWQGIGFSIPSNIAGRVLQSLITRGRVVRAYLGVMIESITPAMVQSLHLPSNSGALVTGIVPGAPAQKAGIRPGDIIIAISGRPVASIQDLRNLVSGHDVGDKTELMILRRDEKIPVSLVLDEQPPEAALVPATPDLQPKGNGQSSRSSIPPMLNGMEVGPVSDEVRKRIPAGTEGVQVIKAPPILANPSVLLPGDIIEMVNKQPVPDVDSFFRVFQAGAKGDIWLSICRPGAGRSLIRIGSSQLP